MTTDQTIATVRDRLGLTHEQADGLLPALRQAVADGLSIDGVCHLGALGSVHLGLWPRRVKADGSVRPAIPCAHFRPSQTLRKEVERVPVRSAQLAARGSSLRLRDRGED